ncbi:MAG: acyltransferase [Bacteroidota bacterium]
MKERFEVLDIFRGIFSSMVVFFHMSTFSDTPILNNDLVYNADLFVDFFFVLSGFVITYSYQYISDNQQFTRFYKKRFFRLYPLHIIMLFAFLGVEVSKHFLSNYIHVNELNNADNNILTFFSSLFLLNSVKLPGVKDVSWNLPSWSISAEMIAYFVFGIVMIFIHKQKLFKYRNAIYALLLSVVLAVFYLITGGFKLTYSFDYGFLRSVIGFFTGVLCYNLIRGLKVTGLLFH